MNGPFFILLGGNLSFWDFWRTPNWLHVSAPFSLKNACIHRIMGRPDTPLILSFQVKVFVWFDSFLFWNDNIWSDQFWCEAETFLPHWKNSLDPQMVAWLCTGSQCIVSPGIAMQAIICGVFFTFTLIVHTICLFDSISTSDQRYFSYKGKGLPGLNQY